MLYVDQFPSVWLVAARWMALLGLLLCAVSWAVRRRRQREFIPRPFAVPWIVACWIVASVALLSLWQRASELRGLLGHEDWRREWAVELGPDLGWVLVLIAASVWMCFEARATRHGARLP